MALLMPSSIIVDNGRRIGACTAADSNWKRRRRNDAARCWPDLHANRSLSIMGELEAAAAAAAGAVMTAMTAGVTTVELGSSGRHWRMQTPPSLILKLFRVTNCSIETNQRMYDCINESASKWIGYDKYSPQNRSRSWQSNQRAICHIMLLSFQL